MRVVLDTNVLMSGIFWSGPPARILAEWSEGRFDFLASLEILTEYRLVGKRLAKKYRSLELGPVLDLVIRESRIVEPVPQPSHACDDPDDVKFLACAIAGKAASVVSGDRALLRASGYKGIEVVRPKDFLEQYLNE
jgi:putative PIN family toxin of toxin-antitoxin system